MNTRLTLSIRTEIAEALDELMHWPVRFQAPPGILGSAEGRRRFWISLFPQAVQEMRTVGAEWGYSWPAAQIASVRVNLGESKLVLNLGCEQLPEDSHGGYIVAAPGVVNKFWRGETPLIENPEAAFGAEWPEIHEWMKNAVQDSNEARLTKKVFDDLLGMCVTAGQLKRMVPDLLKYLPPHKVAVLAQQTRASSLPFDWAAYPRDDVEKAITYIAKCHILTGLGNPVRQHLCRGEYTTWVTDPSAAVARD
jgi:hypothetical protein